MALPYADTDMMQLHLDEISSNVAKGAHAVVLLDRAGWHITSKLDMPETYTPIFLPSRAPELNPVENVWQYLRQNWISNTVFENYDAIVDAACDAWRKLTARPETITSIGMHNWAHVGQSLYLNLARIIAQVEGSGDGGWAGAWINGRRQSRAIPLRLFGKPLVARAVERRRRRAEVFATLEENVGTVAADRGEHFRRNEVAFGLQGVERLQERRGFDLAEVLDVEPVAPCGGDGHLPVFDRDAPRAPVLGVGFGSRQNLSEMICGVDGVRINRLVRRRRAEGRHNERQAADNRTKHESPLIFSSS